jgi:hypothetical protein
MRATLRLTVLLSAVVLLAGPNVDLRSAPPPKKELTEPEMRQALLAKPFLEGKLVDIDRTSEEKTFTLKVVWQVKTPSVEGSRRFRQVRQDLINRANQAIQQKNQQEFERLRDEYAAAEAACYDIEETPLDFHLKATADLKFRRMELPPRETPDGKVMRYTEKEKAELRGKDTTLPGFKADLADFEDGCTVRVYLEKKKAPAANPKDKPADPKDKAADPKEKPKEATEATPADTIYPVVTILLMPEPKTPDALNPFGK